MASQTTLKSAAHFRQVAALHLKVHCQLAGMGWKRPPWGRCQSLRHAAVLRKLGLAQQCGHLQGEGSLASGFLLHAASAVLLCHMCPV